MVFYVRFVFSKITLAAVRRMDCKESRVEAERTVRGISSSSNERQLDCELKEMEIEEQL